MVTEQPNAAAVATVQRTLAELDSKAAGLRQDLLELRQKLSRARQELSESHSAQLQEANQQLVLAALHADKIAETALADLAALSVAYRHDAVTGIPNRALMLENLQGSLLMARRHQRRLAVIFIDLDHFKSINDSLGHAGGDEVLQIVARALQSVLRASDTVSRYGGDEFLVLLQEISAPADANRIAEEMLAALSVPVSVGGQILTLSASLGISIHPEDGEDAVTLVNRADAAMYRNKRAGRGGDGHADDPAPPPSMVIGLPGDAARKATPDSPLDDLREANGQLVLAALTAQESAAHATEAQRQQLKFMAVVAHELRNPLTPLRIATDLLLNRSGNGEIPIERLQVIIDDQVTHMTRLVDDLLDGSRLSTGKWQIERKEVNLRDILEQVVASCRPGMEFRQQHFSLVMPSAPVLISGDTMRLAQVFRNLLDNARKYTPEHGEIALELKLHDTHAVVTVRDNGIGISAKALPTIFNLFMQDARALPHSNGGLGIGLAVVRELVQAHGGSVVAHSSGRGGGSEFVVTLPLCLPTDLAAAPCRAPGRHPAPSDSCRNRRPPSAPAHAPVVRR